jgi:hypothetical protein
MVVFRFKRQRAFKKALEVRHTSPSLFPSFSTGRRMGVILMLCGAPSGNEVKQEVTKKERGLK